MNEVEGNILWEFFPSSDSQLFDIPGNDTIAHWIWYLNMKTGFILIPSN